MKKKTLKIILLSVVIVCLVGSVFFFVPDTSAKTLRDFYEELSDLKKEKKRQEQEEALTEEKYKQTIKDIDDTEKAIDRGRKQVKESKKKIEDLKVEIDKKNLEIEELLRFLQISDGENVYLEYIFGASDFTDFIYRTAIVEQLTDYNNNLINEMNDLIEVNIQLQKDLADKEDELEASKKKLEGQLASLGSKLKQFDKYALTIDQEIAAVQESIDYYEDKGCDMDQDTRDCVKIPYASGFTRPVVSGGISSTFGKGGYGGGDPSFHSGIDIWTTIGEGSKIYASAPGIVSAKVRRSSCGGNILYIKHEVNGVHYTTIYMHLLQFKVNVGDEVNENTIVGLMGGGRTTEKYDNCTFGAHLHFGMTKGWYLGGDYTNWYTYRANLLDPQDYIYFPDRDGRYYERYY